MDLKRKKIYKYEDIDLQYRPLPDVIADLQAILAKHPEAIIDEREKSWDMGVQSIVSWLEDESDHDYKVRVARYKANRKQEQKDKAEQEKKEYERLKAKFEKP